MPQPSRPSGQSGFSLIELIVAMAVTLVVTGAVYGLMAGGNNAFRREPELTERQQNVRVAMDLIQKDIATAGVNMGPFFQTFSQGLNAAGRITGPAGQVADHLEVFGNDGTCPEVASADPPLAGDNFDAIGHLPDCYSEDAIVLVTYANGGAKWGVGHEIRTKGKINFPPGKADGSQIDSVDRLRCFAENTKKGEPGCSVPNGLSPVNILRYEIALDPVDNVPSLYRSPTGGRDPEGDGNYLPPTSPANVIAGRWQLIARGIEDLQIQYKNGNGAWTDDPGNVLCTGSCAAPTEVDYNKGVREVRVTISGRAEGQNLAGQTQSTLVAGPGSRVNAVRGSATAVMTVKPLQVYLAAIGPLSTGGSCPTCPVWR